MRILFAMIMFAALLLAGCGVSEETFQQTVSERDNALAQVQTSQVEKGGLLAQKEVLERDIAALRDDIEAARVGIDAAGQAQAEAETETDARQGELEEAQAEALPYEQRAQAAEDGLNEIQKELDPVYEALNSSVRVMNALLTFQNGVLLYMEGAMSEDEFSGLGMATRLIITSAMSHGPLHENDTVNGYWESFIGSDADDDSLSYYLKFLGSVLDVLNEATEDFDSYVK